VDARDKRGHDEGEVSVNTLLVIVTRCHDRQARKKSSEIINLKN
jgi:hypothetical protein